MNRAILGLILILTLGSCSQTKGTEITLDIKSGGKNKIVKTLVKLPKNFSNQSVTVKLGDKSYTGQISAPSLNSNATEGQQELTFIGDVSAGSHKISLETIKDNPAFKWTKTEGKYITLSHSGKNQIRYMMQKLDETSKQTREATYKPYHHVFDAAGKGYLTKGPGGRFTHHRAIYYGFSKCSYERDGKKFGADTWHCRQGAFQSHQKVISETAGSVFGRHRVLIHWHGKDGKMFATEERELTVYIIDGAKVIDFQSRLSTTLKNMRVDGDPQHAGFQYRASNEVASKTAKQTYYIRPDGKDAMGKTRNWPGNKDQTNLPWKAQSTVIGGERYTVSYLDHPNNPKPSFFSERDYGRFGSFFRSPVTAEKPLKIKYRLIIKKGESSVDELKEQSKSFTGK